MNYLVFPFCREGSLLLVSRMWNKVTVGESLLASFAPCFYFSHKSHWVSQLERGGERTDMTLANWNQRNQRFHKPIDSGNPVNGSFEQHGGFK